jgi:hypothetical protein
MKNNLINKANPAKGKSGFYLFICALTFATLTLGACNSKSSSNTNNGDPAVQNDTSSAVTHRVDTQATDSGTKQP